MKILFLSKRFYMSRDLLQHRYGRFYEIPAAIARNGHQVKLISLAYHRVSGVESLDEGYLQVQSYQLGINPLSGFMRHYQRLEWYMDEFEPDVIIAASDCYHIILGSELAKRRGIPLIADLYDNFEAYRASHVPGILPWFYHSLANASVVTTVSSSLRDYLYEKLGTKARIQVIENAVTSFFLSGGEKEDDRRQLGFASDSICIGTAGDLSDQRGIDVLIKAFLKLSAANPRLHLVLAGRPGAMLTRLARAHPNLILLGQIDHATIPVLFTALDIGVISLRDDVFGRYCFPQKYYEMVARKLPLVGAAVGEMKTLLASFPGLLYRPNDVEDLMRAINFQIVHRVTLSNPVPTWEDQALKFSQSIQQAVKPDENFSGKTDTD